MTKSTTLDDVYAAINPLSARLLEKGKAEPVVRFEMEANAGMCVAMNWKKRSSPSTWDREYQCFLGDSLDQALSKAVAFISRLPSAEQAVLHEFMDKLGKLIDAGRSDGIAVDYMNPLLDTMKRLSENIITYRPAP